MHLAKVHVFSIKRYQKGAAERFLEKNEIPFEHSIAVTRDGYKLTMQHLLPLFSSAERAAFSPRKKSKGTVIFLHGMFESSAMAFSHGTASLPVTLASSGWDVYLGNVRGNLYGLGHEKLSPWSDEFWDFSIREHAQEDFPAMVKQVLKETGRSQIDAVYGTSQGALVALMGIAKNAAALNEAIRLCVAVAPALVLRRPTNKLVRVVFDTDPAIMGERQ